MHPYTSSEVAETLKKARNPNAALKNFLKQELAGTSDPATERFVKDLRGAVSLKQPTALQNIIERGLPKFEKHLFVILRHAYNEPLSVIAEQVVTRYADEFNKTYEQVEDGIRVKDELNFRRIFSAAEALFEEGLKEQQLEDSGLMKNVLVTFVFEPAVIDYIYPASA